MKDFPTSAELLNGWINAHFQVFSGPPRAYIELPFPVTVGFEEEKAYCSTIHRIVYLSLGFKGPEEDCCKAIASWLYMQITYEEYCDSVVPIFIRRPFAYEKDGQAEFVLGRLAFWDSNKNRELIKSPAYKPEGAIARMPVVPPEIFNRR